MSHTFLIHTDTFTPLSSRQSFYQDGDQFILLFFAAFFVHDAQTFRGHILRDLCNKYSILTSCRTESYGQHRSLENSKSTAIVPSLSPSRDMNADWMLFRLLWMNAWWLHCFTHVSNQMQAAWKEWSKIVSVEVVFVSVVTMVFKTALDKKLKGFKWTLPWSRFLRWTHLSDVVVGVPDVFAEQQRDQWLHFLGTISRGLERETKTLDSVYTRRYISSKQNRTKRHIISLNGLVSNNYTTDALTGHQLNFAKFWILGTGTGKIWKSTTFLAGKIFAKPLLANFQ